MSLTCSHLPEMPSGALLVGALWFCRCRRFWGIPILEGLRWTGRFEEQGERRSPPRWTGHPVLNPGESWLVELAHGAEEGDEQSVCHIDGAGNPIPVDFHGDELRTWAAKTPEITRALLGLLKCSHSDAPPCAACRRAGWAALEEAGLVP